jgi:hypothetical protein
MVSWEIQGIYKGIKNNPNHNRRESMKTQAEESILKAHIHKEMLGLFRKTLTAISKLNLRELEVHLTASFQGPEFTIHMTIFNGGGGDNRSVNLYDFYTIEKNTEIIGEIMGLIKKDDFSLILEYSGH